MNRIMWSNFNAYLVVLAVAVCGCEKKQPQIVIHNQLPPPIRSIVAVAAASDLKYAFDELVAEFKKSNPNVEVQTSYGSSGNIYSQLCNQAPFDLFLSADIQYPRKLIDQRLASKETEFTYAIGQIVVWVRNESPLDLEDLGMHALLEPAVQKIAIANPQHAPYGRAAEAAMKHLNVYDTIKDRLVLGENISQAAQYIESGAADIGVIALSLAMAPSLKEKGRYWVVPQEAYPKLEQGGVILSSAKHPEATELLRSFIIGKAARAVLQRYGFQLPGE